jgi:hypothetical protein
MGITAQFRSIRHGLWPVTQNTDSALRQPTKFGVTLPKIWHTRWKFSKILPFLHPRERFGPDVMHFTFGTGCHDLWPRPKFIAAQGVRDAWPPNWMKLRSIAVTVDVCLAVALILLYTCTNLRLVLLPSQEGQKSGRLSHPLLLWLLKLPI